MTATIELTSARRKLCAALGEKQKEYFSHMKSWFRKRISKEEFDIEARKLIPAENSHLHNEFFLAILNKCQTLALASFQPSISLASKTNSSETSYLQSSQSRLIKGEIPSKMTCVDPSSILIPRKYEGDERLKIGSYNKQKNKNMNFEYRFQAQPVYSFVQDIDEIHANVETLPDQNYMLAQKEPTIPDSALIHGRLLMAAWEEGMEGPGTAEEEVVRIIEIAVEQALRNLVTALLMDRNGYRLKSGAPFAVGNPAPDPWIWNTRKNETKKKIGTTESLNPEHPVPVPKSRPTQKDAEHAAMMETACSARDDTERESYLPREPITLFDLFNTMQKHKNLIPSHTVYALNMERIVSRLHHEGRDDY